MNYVQLRSTIVRYQLSVSVSGIIQLHGSVELRVPDLGDIALIQEPYVLNGTPRYLDKEVGNIFAFKGLLRARPECLFV